MEKELEALIEKGRKNKDTSEPTTKPFNWHYIYLSIVAVVGVFGFYMGQQTLPKQSISAGDGGVSIVSSSDTVVVSGSNNIIANSETANTVQWGELSSDTRKMYRGMVYAYFPDVIKNDNSVNWDKIQDWLRDDQRITVTNIRDVMRSSRRDGLPRQIATLLAHKERIYQALRVGYPSDFLPFWKVKPKTKDKERQLQWVEMAMTEIARSYGKDILAIVLKEFEEAFHDS